jgi:hypothetical protein
MLISIVWLCLNENHSADAKSETIETPPVVPIFAKPLRVTSGRSYLVASIPQPGSFRGEIARR